MLVLVLAGGVCANPSVTSNSAGTTMNTNARFMEILRKFSPCGGVKFRLGFGSASDSGVEPSRLSGSGLRTWSIQGKLHNSIRWGCGRLCQTAHIQMQAGRGSGKCEAKDGEALFAWERDEREAGEVFGRLAG